jgi:hypothetical protein
MRKKTIKQYLKEIRNIVGKNYIHKEHGNFKYYTSGDYTVVYTLKNKTIEEIVDHNVFDNKPPEVTFKLTDKIPTEEDILKIVRNAKLTIAKIDKKVFKKDKQERIKDLKIKIKELEKEIKETKK